MSLVVAEWIDCKAEQALEPGLLNIARTLGATVNFIAGAYVINKPIIHPWTGGVMWMDWSLANVQESPLVIEKYYRDLEKPFVWWSDLRHEPPDFEEQLKWMGLACIDKMVGLSYDMSTFRMHHFPDKFDVFMARESRDMEEFVHLFDKCFDYSDAFKDEIRPQFRNQKFNGRVIHHIGYYRGHPVGIGTYAALTDHALIMNLGTDPKYRGNGYGTLMLENLLATAYTHEMRKVLVIASQKEASFFLSRGFEKKVDFNVYASQEIRKRWPQDSNK